MDDHLTGRYHGGWSVWRWAALRSAGFSIDGVDALSYRSSAVAAGAQIGAERDLSRREADVLDALDHADVPPPVAADVRRQIRLDREIPVDELPPSLRPPVVSLAAARAALVDAWARYDAAFDGDSASSRVALCRIAEDPDFREAVLWQNPSAYGSGVTYVRRHARDPKTTSRFRSNEELVVSYWLRYCAKNETIGFFGPLAWALIGGPGAGAPVTRLHDEWIEQRQVHFESWAIDEAAAALSARPELRSCLPLWRSATLAVSPDGVTDANGAPVELRSAEAAVLARADGSHTSAEVLAELDGHAEHAVAALIERGLLRAELNIPWDLHPEAVLAGDLRRIARHARCESACLEADRSLRALCEAKGNVARAGGDVTRLESALRELDDEFTRLTGASPRRAAGQTYAARTLVYEEAMRGVDVALGDDLLETLMTPLTLVLTSCRWLTDRVRTLVDDMARQAVGERGGERVMFAQLLGDVLPRLLDAEHGPVAQAYSAFHERWRHALALDVDAPHLRRDATSLRDPVEAAFGGAPPGWSLARQHSPDVAFRAGVREGDGRWVLGELHVALNTLEAPIFTARHAEPERLTRALKADLGVGRLLPSLPKGWPAVTNRTLPTFGTDEDYYFLLTDTDSGGLRNRRHLPIGSLCVQARGDRLVVRNLYGAQEWDLVEALALPLSYTVGNSFSVVPDVALHTPRVAIDDLVVARETWRWPQPSELAFAFESSRKERFLRARELAATSGLPRLTFVKVPGERKPFLVDWENAVAVDACARAIRRCVRGDAGGALVVTEMLPTPAECWLRDPAGRPFTSEFRMVCTDVAHAR